LRHPVLTPHYHYPPITEAHVRGGCYLTGIGRGSIPPGTRYPPPGHPERYAFDFARGRLFGDFGLVWIAGGRGVFEAERGVRQAVREGDFLCLTPGRWHRYAPDRATGWEECWVCFNGDYPHRLQRAGELPQEPRRIRLDCPGAYERRLLQLLASAGTSEPTTTLAMGLRALALFAEIAAGPAEESAREDDGGSAPAGAANLVAEGKRFIEENLHRPIDLSALAASLGVTRRTLERRFRKEAGIPPGDYLIRCRVERAARMIASTGMPLKAVGYACGFSSPGQMIYGFRRHKGLAPGKFRAPGGGA
jgi:AraC-like DNA-binding protein